jgi:hypothetical protein
VVTDGAETCDSNPVGAAAEVKSSTLQIRVDVIGFAVNTAEQSSLQAISTSGGGLFSIAANADQLLSQMQASRENFEKFQAGAQCATEAYQKAIACLQDVQQKVFQYLQTQLVNLHGSENQELSNLQSQISDKYFKKVNELQEEWNNQIKSQQNLLNQ